MKINKAFIITILLVGTFLHSRAQLAPFQAMYFQNPYQYNPAMAGVDKGLNINLGYRQQWKSFPSAPKTSALTADFQATNRVGLGINVNDDQAGLIRSTRIMGTYSYHIPLSANGDRLNFGLSFGINHSRVDYNRIDGDISDAEISKYNQLKPYADGDFGVAYTSDHLYIGGAIPNLRSAVYQTSDERFGADRLLFIGVASYKLSLNGDDQIFILEPLVGMRIIKGYNNIVDAGFNFKIYNMAYFQMIYHTSNNMGLGIGLDLQTCAFNLCYNLEAGALSNERQSAFEVGIRFRLFRN